jgi:hypothetical protein
MLVDQLAYVEPCPLIENFCEAVSAERTNARAKVEAGLNKVATRVTRGAISLSSSTHFPPMVVSKFVKPLVLPPGRARLATKPRSTGSLTPVKAIGIVRVACCAAVNAGPPSAKNHVRRQAEDLRNCGAGLFKVVHAQLVFDREITPNCPPQLFKALQTLPAH